MSNQFVTYDQFDGNMLKAIAPSTNSFELKGSTITYHDIKFLYNYGTHEKPIVTGCYFELPEIEATGIKLRQEDAVNKKGESYVKKSYSMMFRYNLQNPEITLCLTKIRELYMSVAKIVGQYKGKVGLPHFDFERPFGTITDPIYYMRDEGTGEVVEGTNPTQWVQLLNYATNKSVFTDLEGNSIDWSLLQDVELKLVPLLHVQMIRIGTHKTIKFSLVSAIVTHIQAANSSTRQNSTLERLRQKNSALTEQVASQLAQLRMDRQDSLDTPTTATLPSDTGTMESIESPPENQKNQLDDFLNGAPSIPVQKVEQTYNTQTNIPPPSVNTSLQQGLPQNVQLHLNPPPTSTPIQFN